jgi:hypothetical protein
MKPSYINYQGEQGCRDRPTCVYVHSIQSSTVGCKVAIEIILKEHCLYYISKVWIDSSRIYGNFYLCLESLSDIIVKCGNKGEILAIEKQRGYYSQTRI